MIPALGILHSLQMLRQLLFIIVCCSINALQSGLLGITPPISHGRRGQFEGLDALCAHQMRAGAQVHEVTLTVKRNLRVLGQIPYQLRLIRLLFVLHELDRFRPRQGKFIQLDALFDDLLHLRLQGIQILSGKRSVVKIIIKSRVDAGADGKSGLREQALHRLRKHMGGSVANGRQPLRVGGGADRQPAVPIDDGAQIHSLSVRLSAACRPGKPLADIHSYVIHAHSLFILLHGAVLQCNLHHSTSLPNLVGIYPNIECFSIPLRLFHSSTLFRR